MLLGGREVDCTTDALLRKEKRTAEQGRRCIMETLLIVLLGWVGEEVGNWVGEEVGNGYTAE